MTKIEELSEAIAKKNQSKKENEEDDDLEVSGAESTKKPLVSFGDDETDMDLIDQLYSKGKHKPLEGQFAQKWD